MSLVFLPLMVATIAALAWWWWAGRLARHPKSSIASFHRALEAMQPGGHAPEDVPEAHVEHRAGQR